jgi:hypothetical protein
MQYRIVCHHDRVSGGPEALHQLTRAWVDAGRDACIVYMPLAPDNRCPPRFQHYAAPMANALIDREDQVIVLPETMTHMAWQFQRAQVVLWWLSVDNYFKTLPEKALKRLREHWRARWGRGRYYQFERHPHLTHAWQSEYARRFLVARGIADSLPLTDYLAPAMVSDVAQPLRLQRRDECLYNPLKGKLFTDRLRAHCAELPLEFVPLQGLSEQQMGERLGAAKLYVDFGEHPGRDRIPREAALGGCVVVTGRLGSAGNEVDVPLPEAYKLDQSAPDALDRVRALLSSVQADHATHLARQHTFGEGIRGQRRAFELEALALAQKLETAR